MKKLIIDCDNTFGVEGCDIDDGLAILYALGSGKCRVVAVSTTFGNSSLDVVFPNTVAFLKRIGREDIPVLQGHGTDAEKNRAAGFLVDQANREPGQVSILATGSLTNLYHAWQLDHTFFDKVSELSLMGGVTQPLMIGGRQLDELNFSCNSEAAFQVLTRGRFLHIATGNNCLAARFPQWEFDRLEHSERPLLRWLHGQARYWFQREREAFGHDGIYKWDVFAAAALLNPQLFHQCPVEICPDRQSLQSGNLLGAGEVRRVWLPQVKDKEEYRAHVYAAYDQFAGNQ